MHICGRILDRIINQHVMGLPDEASRDGYMNCSEIHKLVFSFVPACSIRSKYWISVKEQLIISFCGVNGTMVFGKCID